MVIFHWLFVKATGGLAQGTATGLASYKFERPWPWFVEKNYNTAGFHQISKGPAPNFNIYALWWILPYSTPKKKAFLNFMIHTRQILRA